MYLPTFVFAMTEEGGLVFSALLEVFLSAGARSKSLRVRYLEIPKEGL